jgi:transposase InsO family protein
MEDDQLRKERARAVHRLIEGETPQAICASLKRSKAWLYKWLERYLTGEENWNQGHTHRPSTFPRRTSSETEELVKMIRLNLYNRDVFCGAQAIRWEMEDLGLAPPPSIRTINRILGREGLTHRRTGIYAPKGKAYPKLPALFPNQTHQADLVGPCYLKGPLRFYSYNVVDIATGRCGIQPSSSKSAQSIIDAVWATWRRIGIPINLQVDNDMSFYGSPTHPRGMGPLIRLCLHHRVEPWFIPVAEPWRNGVVEKFNDHYQDRFLDKVQMATEPELISQSLNFELRHNSSYRYSKLGGKTPLKALQASEAKLRFPDTEYAPLHRLKKPTTGRYHLVRFIRGDRKLNVFGELFRVPLELQYEYVVATIDVKEQKLNLFLDKTQVEQFNYRLR